MPSSALQYEGNNFDGAVLPGRPRPPPELDLAEVHRYAQQPVAQPFSAQRLAVSV